MTEAFAEALGLSKEALMQELVASRETMQKEFDAQFVVVVVVSNEMHSLLLLLLLQKECRCTDAGIGC